MSRLEISSQHACVRLGVLCVFPDHVVFLDICLAGGGGRKEPSQNQADGTHAVCFRLSAAITALTANRRM